MYWFKLSAQAEYDTRSLFKRFKFYFSETICYTMIKKHNMPYYLLIAGGRIVGCVRFPSVLALWEMQIALSRTRTRVADFIFN